MSHTCLVFNLVLSLCSAKCRGDGTPEERPKVWLEGPGTDQNNITVGQSVEIKWNFFVTGNGGKGYAWIASLGANSDSGYLPLTGNTAPTGSFIWEVPQSRCGKRLQVKVCCGDPPRTSKYACHRSDTYTVYGACRQPSRLANATIETSPKIQSKEIDTTIREMGPLQLRRKPLVKYPQEVASSPISPPFTIALVVLWLGPLPDYTTAFSASASALAESGITFFVFHSHEESHVPREPNVNFVHLSLADLSKRLWSIEGLHAHLSAETFDVLHERVVESFAEDNGAKGNDLKPLFGALFAKELANFTHYGWTDLDVIWGDLEMALTEERLSEYDVLSFPDGYVNALYLSGQLTVFQNTPKLRMFFLGCLKDIQGAQAAYGSCLADRIVSEAHLHWDERVAIWYAVAHGARIWVDFSAALSARLWSTFGKDVLVRAHRQLLLMLSSPYLEFVPHVDLEHINMELHRLQNISNCYSEFGDGWSFACIPNGDSGKGPMSLGTSHGVAYSIEAKTIIPRPSPLKLSSASSLEFAFLHLHTMKNKFYLSADALANDAWECIYDTHGDIRCSGAAIPRTAQSPRIPNLVHFVLTDRDTRFFDWTCYTAIRSAAEKLRPKNIWVHVLDGVEPKLADDWWQAAMKYVSRVLPFNRSAVPLALNGIKLRHPAMIGDFYRMQVLYEYGGIYMDTDALSLRTFDDLRWHRAVFGRQGGEFLRPAVGLMMFEPRSPLAKYFLDEMKTAYNGVWAAHSVHALEKLLQEKKPPGVAILAHSSGFFASSWHIGDFYDLLEGEGQVDWNLAWSLHLYHSQTGEHTKNPKQLCGGSTKVKGDLCKGLAQSINLQSLYELVDSGFPVADVSLENKFLERQKNQMVEFPSNPVARDLELVRADPHEL